MTQNILNYDTKQLGDESVETRFQLINYPVAFGNSLRRTIISNIPTAAFSDVWEDDVSKRSIVIQKNTSGIHNEFLAHRLSLVPLRITNELKINSQFNLKDGLRTYGFIDKEHIPIFSLDIKNDKITRENRSCIGSIHITTNDLTLLDLDYGSPITSDMFIKPDPYTNEYIKLDIIKPNILDEAEGEELILTAKPTVGLGSINARYTPVGTVSYNFETDPTKIDVVFNDKLQYKNQERREKELDPLNEVEIAKMKKSFLLLDGHRVVYTDDQGNPSIINFRIESIGFLKSEQIVYDGLYSLELMIRDILNSIKYINKESLFNLNSSKIDLSESYDNLQGFIFQIHNENHTIGNLISEYFKQMYCCSDPIDCDIVTFASYRMPHPLQEKIEIKLKLNKILENDAMLDSLYKQLCSHLDFQENQYHKLKTPFTKKKDIISIVFIKTLSYILSDILKLKSQWTTVSGISEPSFISTDSVEYFEHFTDIGTSLNIKDFMDNFTEEFHKPGKHTTNIAQITEDIASPIVSMEIQTTPDSTQPRYNKQPPPEGLYIQQTFEKKDPTINSVEKQNTVNSYKDKNLSISSTISTTQTEGSVGQTFEEINSVVNSVETQNTVKSNKDKSSTTSSIVSTTLPEGSDEKPKRIKLKIVKK